MNIVFVPIITTNCVYRYCHMHKYRSCRFLSIFRYHLLSSRQNLRVSNVLQWLNV